MPFISSLTVLGSRWRNRDWNPLNTSGGPLDLANRKPVRLNLANEYPASPRHCNTHTVFSIQDLDDRFEGGTLILDWITGVLKPRIRYPWYRCNLDLLIFSRGTLTGRMVLFALLVYLVSLCAVTLAP